MDKIKNILHPGKKEDDEILYGSGQSSDPVHSGRDGKIAGEGSRTTQFNTSTGQEEPLSGSGAYSTNPTSTTGSSAYGTSTTAGPHSSSLSNKADPRVDSDRDRSRNTGVGHTTTATGAASDTSNTGYNTGTNTTAGPHTSNVANKADPRVDSGRDGSRTAAAGAAHPSRGDGVPSGTATATPYSSTTANRADPNVGTGSNTSQGLGTRTTATNAPTDMPGGFPGDGVSSYPGSNQSTGAAAVSGSTNKPLPHTPASGPGATGSNLPDRSVTSSDYGRTPGPTTSSNTSHLGRDAALGGGAAVGAGAAARHYQHDNTRDHPSTGNTGPATTSSDRTFPLTGATSTSTAQRSTPGTSSATTTAGPHSSNAANKADPRVDSDLDRSRNAGLTGSNQPGYGAASGADRTSAQGHQPNRDGQIAAGAALAAASAPGSHAYDRHITGQGAAPTGSEYSGSTPSGAGGSYHTSPRGTAVAQGVHPTATANKLDPAIAGDSQERERPSSTVGPHAQDVVDKDGSRADHDHSHRTGGLSSTTGPGSTNVGTSHENNREHHYGRDAALVGGGAAATGSAYTANPSYSENTSTGPAPSTAGPHKSDFLNKVDPRVDSDLDGSKTVGSAPGATGGAEKKNESGPVSSSVNPYSSSGIDPRVDSTPRSTQGRAGSGYNEPTTDSHRGRDAAYVGGGTAAGAGAYQAGQHRGTEQPTQTFSQPSQATGPHSSSAANKADPRVDSDRSQATRGGDHHYGRDAAYVGGGTAAGAGAYQATQSRGTDQPTSTTANTYGSTTAAGPHSSNAANKADPRVDSDRSQAARGGDHHYGRDAAYVGGGTAAGAGAYQATQSRGTDQPTSTTANTYGSTTTAGPHSSNAANKADPRVDSDRDNYGTRAGDKSQKDHHYGRDAAVVGGTGAAAAGAGYGLSEHEREEETKHAAKEHEKEVKELEKQQKHEAKEAEKHHKQEVKEAEKHHKQEEKEAEKQHKHDVKEAEKHQKKEAEKQHKHDVKEAEKQHKHEAKEAEKIHKQEEKEAEKQHKQEEKEVEKQQKQEEKEEKKHHGLFGFLHRDKDKKYTDEEEEQFARQDREHQSKYGTETGTAATTAEHDGHDHNDRNRLHKDPPPGYVEKVTGGAGTAESTQHRGPHGSDPTNRTDPTVSNRGAHTGASGAGSQGIVTEPHTGLPMDVGKYGTGAGGTDGAPIGGYHEHGTVPTSTTGTSGTTGGATGTASGTSGSTTY
ncbi:MAG: hypothetical protein M1837_005343 [Sclerophora amabilis]|nr:MAG: hypothetical protein M1837_005343 [Sclerophora amabilis]